MDMSRLFASIYIMPFYNFVSILKFEKDTHMKDLLLYVEQT